MKTLQERFEKKYIPVPESGCWIWHAACDGTGYGQIRIEGRNRQAHRVSHELHVGEIPKDVYVLHKCDNRACVNPAHLFLGTALDNARDMIRKGRDVNPKGEANGRSKLTVEHVKQIREMINAGMTSVEIAKRFGVHAQQISSIKRGVTWAHV